MFPSRTEVSNFLSFSHPFRETEDVLLYNFLSLTELRIPGKLLNCQSQRISHVSLAHQLEVNLFYCLPVSPSKQLVFSSSPFLQGFSQLSCPSPLPKEKKKQVKQTPDTKRGRGISENSHGTSTHVPLSFSTWNLSSVIIIKTKVDFVKSCENLGKLQIFDFQVWTFQIFVLEPEWTWNIGLYSRFPFWIFCILRCTVSLQCLLLMNIVHFILEAIPRFSEKIKSLPREKFAFFFPPFDTMNL